MSASSSSAAAPATAKDMTITAANFNLGDITVLPGRDFVSFKDGSMFKFTTSPLAMSWKHLTQEGDIGKMMRMDDGKEQPVARTGCKFGYGLAYAGADPYALEKLPGLAAMNDADFKALHGIFQKIVAEAFDTNNPKVVLFRNKAIVTACTELCKSRNLTKVDAKALYDAGTDKAFNAEVLAQARQNFIDEVPEGKRMPNPATYQGGFKTIVKQDGTTMQTPLRFFTDKKVWVRKDGYKAMPHDKMPATLTHVENNGLGANWFPVYDSMTQYYTYQPVPFYVAATGQRIPQRMIKHGGKFYPDPSFDPTGGNDVFVSVTLSFKLIAAKKNYGIEVMASYVNVVFSKPRAPTYVNPWQSVAEAPAEPVSSETIDDDDDDDAATEAVVVSKKQKTDNVDDEIAAAAAAFAASAEDGESM